MASAWSRCRSSAATSAYRLVNSEGDGLPGLNIDVFGDVAAVQFSALGMKLHEDAVYAALRTLPSPPLCIVEAAAGSFANIEGFASQNRVVFGDESLLADGTLCLENGVRLRIDVREGQKTGAFLDQRDNRLLFGRYCAGAKVLGNIEVGAEARIASGSVVLTNVPPRCTVKPSSV